MYTVETDIEALDQIEALPLKNRVGKRDEESVRAPHPMSLTLPVGPG